MKESQKVIKYVAIAFAILLIYEIIFGIVKALGSIVDLNLDLKSERIEEISTNKIPDNITKLDIDVSVSNLKIENSNKLEISANDNIKLTKKNKTLYIEEKSKKILNRNKENNVVLYIPNDYTFDEITLDTGAGKLEIDTLSVNYLDLDLGAGNVEIENLFVNNETKIDTGAGNVIINNGIINNLDLDMGLGNINLKAKLLGKNDIDCGVGSVNLNLLDNIDDYKIDINKGIGSTIINGDNVSKDTTIGNGNNMLYIDGGVGKLEVSFEN